MGLGLYYQGNNAKFAFNFDVELLVNFMRFVLNATCTNIFLVLCDHLPRSVFSRNESA